MTKLTAQRKEVLKKMTDDRHFEMNGRIAYEHFSGQELRTANWLIENGYAECATMYGVHVGEYVVTAKGLEALGIAPTVSTSEVEQLKAQIVAMQTVWQEVENVMEENAILKIENENMKQAFCNINVMLERQVSFINLKIGREVQKFLQ